MSKNLQSNPIKFKVEINKIDLQSLTNFQAISIFLIIGKKQTKIEGKINELQHMNKVLELDSHIYCDKLSSKFQRRIAEIVIRVGEGINESMYGMIKIDIGDFANNKIEDYTDDFKVEKCVCNSSTLNLHLKLEILEAKEEENLSGALKEKERKSTKSKTDFTISGIKDIGRNSPHVFRSVVGLKKSDLSPSFCDRMSPPIIEESTRDFNSKATHQFQWSFEEDKNGKEPLAHESNCDQNMNISPQNVKSYRIQVQEDSNIKLIIDPEKQKLSKPKNNFIKSNISNIGKLELRKSQKLENQDEDVFLQKSSRDTLKGMITLRNSNIKSETPDWECNRNLKSFDYQLTSRKEQNAKKPCKSNTFMEQETMLEDKKSNQKSNEKSKPKGKQKLLEMLISKVSNIEDSMKTMKTMKESKSQASLLNPSNIRKNEQESNELISLKAEVKQYEEFMSEIAFLLDCKDEKNAIIEQIKEMKKYKSIDRQFCQERQDYHNPM